MAASLHFAETLHPTWAQRFAVERLIAAEHTGFQELLIFDSADWGRVLALDGVVQLTEKDEFTYSEMMAHPALIEIGDARRAMIVGGGDGAVAEEILKHRTIEHVDLVDIDARVIALSREHLTSVNRGALDDPRLRVVVADAARFLSEDVTEPYDLIVADRPDPVGPAQALFAEAFYAGVRDALTESGVAVFQTGVPLLQAEELRAALVQMRRTATHAGAFLTTVPTYIGGPMALAWLSRGRRLGALDDAEIARRTAAAGLDTRCYSAATHRSAFALPPYVKTLVEP